MTSKNQQLAVRLIGFSPPERQMLNSIFRLSSISSRKLGYRIWNATTQEPVDIYLIDGDSDTAVAGWKAEFSDKHGQTVVAGLRNTDIGKAAAPKPLGLKLVGALDKVAGQFLPPAPAITPVMAPESLAITQPAAADEPQVAAIAPRAVDPGSSMSSSMTATASPTPVAAPAPVPVPTAATTPSNPQFRVLAVDDSPLMRSFLHAKLQPYGVTPDIAVTGEEALYKISTQKYDLVFLDVMLPGMDGYDVCKAIKKNKDAAKTRVVMLTSRDKTFDKIRGTMAGCDGYLTKPVDEMKLRGILERFPMGGR